MRRRTIRYLFGRLDGIDARMDALEVGLREAWEANAAAQREAWETNAETLRRLEQRIARTAQVQGSERLALDGIELRNVLWSIAADEPGSRRRLAHARSSPDHELAWTEPDPLVSVIIPTRDRLALLTGRSVPSALGQTHPNVEVVVVGDGEPPEVAEALDALGDARVRYANLTQRAVVSDAADKHWLVAAGVTRNEGMRLARGRWTVSLDDDDALRPDAVARLLELARSERVEVAYGLLEQHGAEVEGDLIGTFPPARGFSWGGALAHGSLRCFERELVAAEFGDPGDFFLMERMVRAGVRFAMLDAVTCDYYPSRG